MPSKTIETRAMVSGEHLYQPPRKPAHADLEAFQATPDGIDWTSRINGESYAAQVKQHIFNGASFDCFGSLRQQLEIIDPLTASNLRESLQERGVGDPFIHPILPDLSREDKVTVISAGRLAFQRESHSSPQWFWPPETALDTETLEVVAEAGYAGVLCAPDQLKLASGGEADNLLSQIQLPSGRKILALPFDRPVSQELAFSPKRNADQFLHNVIIPRIDRLPPGVPLVTWTDGETFGHHSKWADHFLAHLLFTSLQQEDIDLISINDVIEAWRGKEISSAHLHERSAWSCPHGDLVRWHGNCGCSGNTSGDWKGPFYAALHQVNASVTSVVKGEMGTEYQAKLIDRFPQLLISPGKPSSTPTSSLLSAKASALTGLTSCGTFFDNPRTAGFINIAFCLQALFHLRDAGLGEQAGRIWQQFEEDLARVHDPTHGGESLRHLPRTLIEKELPQLALAEVR